MERVRRFLYSATVLIAALSGATSVVALYDDDAPIVHITSSNFESEVIKYEGVVLLEGYAPWCGHCQQFAPEYVRVAEKLRGIVKVAALDADAEPDLAKSIGLQGYPTILGFPAMPTMNPYTNKYYKNSKTFVGERTATAVARFATELLPSNVKIITSANYSTFQEECGKTPQVLLFSEKEQTTSLYKSISTYFKNRLMFGQIHSSEEDLVKKFSVDKFPSLLVVSSAKEPIRYDGTFAADVLKEFLESMALPKEAEEGKVSEDKEISTSILRYESLSALESSILEVEAPSVLVIVAGGEGKSCESFESTLPVIEKLAGMVTVGIAEGELADQALKKLKLKPKDCTSLVLFPFGEDTSWSDGELYQGELSAKALQESVLESLPDLTSHISGNVEMETWWFSDGFVAPKVLLFSKKDATPSAYKALAYNFRDQKIKYGLVNAGVSEIVQRFTIPKYPFLLVILGPAAGADPGALQVLPYTGPMNYESLSIWSEGVVQAKAQMENREGENAVNTEKVGDREVVSINSDADLKAACLGQFSLCLLSFIDSDMGYEAEQKEVEEAGDQDSSEGLSKIEMELKYASESTKIPSSAIQIAIIDTPRQEAFSEAFGITATDIPCAVVFNARKLKYARMLGSFTGKNIESFISDTLSGKISTSSIDNLPTLVEGGTARFEVSKASESGTDEGQIMEDEFSLDDIMGEESGGSFLSREQILRQEEEELGEKKKSKKSSKKSKKKSKKGSKTEL